MSTRWRARPALTAGIFAGEQAQLGSVLGFSGVIRAFLSRVLLIGWQCMLLKVGHAVPAL